MATNKKRPASPLDEEERVSKKALVGGGVVVKEFEPVAFCDVEVRCGEWILRAHRAYLWDSGAGLLRRLLECKGEDGTLTRKIELPSDLFVSADEFVRTFYIILPIMSDDEDARSRLSEALTVDAMLRIAHLLNHLEHKVELEGALASLDSRCVVT
jgi:hypothetical protein